MSKKFVKRSVDLANLPSLTKKQKAELAALAARPDSEIDFSDIPPLTEEFWKNAVRGRYYKPTKTSTTVRIDSDVLAWLRAQGKGYQSRINGILWRKMLESLKLGVRAMPIDIDALTEHELIDLNHRIVARLRFLRHLDAHAAMLEFRIGERVTFHPDGRPPVTGMITRYNKKTVSIVTDDGQRWNVAPQFLECAAPRATSKPSNNNVISIQRNDKHSNK